MSNEKSGVYQKYLNSLKEGDKVQAQFLRVFFAHNKGETDDFIVITINKNNIYCTKNGIKEAGITFSKISGKDVFNILQIVVPVEFVNQHL